MASSRSPQQQQLHTLRRRFPVSTRTKSINKKKKAQIGKYDWDFMWSDSIIYTPPPSPPPTPAPAAKCDVVRKGRGRGKARSRSSSPVPKNKWIKRIINKNSNHQPMQKNIRKKRKKVSQEKEDYSFYCLTPEDVNFMFSELLERPNAFTNNNKKPGKSTVENK